MSFLDYNRAIAQVNNALKKYDKKANNIFVIGNHSSTMHVDYSRAIIKDMNDKKINKKIEDILDKEFLDN